VICITTNAELPDPHHNLSGGYLIAVDEAGAHTETTQILSTDKSKEANPL